MCGGTKRVVPITLHRSALEHLAAKLPAAARLGNAVPGLSPRRHRPRGIFFEESVVRFAPTRAGESTVQRIKLCNGSKHDANLRLVVPEGAPFRLRRGHREIKSLRAGKFVLLPVTARPLPIHRGASHNVTLTALTSERGCEPMHSNLMLCLDVAPERE